MSPDFPGLLLFHCQLSGLGWSIQLRKSLFCFADSNFHSWPHCPAKLAFALAWEDDACTCRSITRPGLAHCLERRIYLSMGHSYGSGPWGDFLEHDGAQSSRRRSAANGAEPANLL